MAQQTKQHQRFDDYSEVKECTECEHWWTNACDGTSFGSERPCTGFLACRRVSIPEDIKALQRAYTSLKWHIWALYVLLGILVITRMLI